MSRYRDEFTKLTSDQVKELASAGVNSARANHKKGQKFSKTLEDGLKPVVRGTLDLAGVPDVASKVIAEYGTKYSQSVLLAKQLEKLGEKTGQKKEKKGVTQETSQKRKVSPAVSMPSI